MWIERLTASRTTQAVELAARFAEQRQAVLAENLANVDTPDYHTQRLDVQSFQKSLGEALQRTTNERDPLELRGNAQFQTKADGRLEVQPSHEPAPNVLFHDGTNVRLEQLMTDVNANAASHELALNLLRTRFDTVLRAIRGRTT